MYICKHACKCVCIEHNMCIVCMSVTVEYVSITKMNAAKWFQYNQSMSWRYINAADMRLHLNI